MANVSFEELLFTSIKNGQSTKSVYDLWLELGNTGTPSDFLNSLKGSSAIIVKNVTIPTSNWCRKSIMTSFLQLSAKSWA